MAVDVEIQHYVVILALKTVHTKLLLAFGCELCQTYDRLVAMCCPVKGLIFDLCLTMMSCSWTKKGRLKDVGVQ